VDQALLRALIDLRDRTIQKSRIGFSNRVSAVDRGTDVMDEQSFKLLERWLERFNMLEAELDNDIETLVEGEEIVEYAIAVKGIGKMLAAKAICMIDIERADTVSALWRYAGYGVVDGEREKPTKGEKLHYNARLKTTCYLIGSSFLRSNSPYRQVYDDARVFYEANRPDWTKGHQHNAATRKMIKVWLSHLWEVWRKLEGLPVRDLYVTEHLGHNHYMRPQDFGWPEIADKKEQTI